MVPSSNVVFIDRNLQELDDMLREYDMERDSVEINHRAPQWSHNAMWNRKYMEPMTGHTLRQLWADSEPAIGRKSSPSSDVKDSDIRRAVAALADLPSSTLPDSPFILALGTPAVQNVPPQTGTLALRALEEWERTLCENKAVAILEQMQAGRPALIQKDGGEMLIAIVLDRPLADSAQGISRRQWPRFCSKSKVIHLLRTWSSQQEVVTHLPQTAQPVAPAAWTPQRRYARAVPVIAYGQRGYLRLPHTTRDHCATQVLSPWGLHGWVVLSWLRIPFTLDNWLCSKLAWVIRGREEGGGGQ